MASHKFGYLDLDDIEGGWAELYQSIPTWITEIRKTIYEPLSKEEEMELIRTYKYGYGQEALKAKEAIIRHNLRFVVNIARHYLHNEIEPLELISAGNEALIDALKKFDPEREVKFITYAVNLIRAAMIDVLRDTSAIQLSRKAVQLLNDYIELGDVKQMKEIYPNRYEQSIEKLEAKLEKYLSIRYMSSIDKPFEDGTSTAEQIEDKSSEPFTYGDEIKNILKDAMLEPMEQAVLHLNFGLDGDPPMGLRKVANKLDSNLTKVSKIRNAAFDKLKDNIRLKEILAIINESDAVTWANPVPYNSPE